MHDGVPAPWSHSPENTHAISFDVCGDELMSCEGRRDDTVWDVDGTGLQEIEDKNLAQKIRDKAGRQPSTRLFTPHAVVMQVEF